MQSLHPATVANFREKVKIVSNELKIFIDPIWIDLCDLAGKNYLINASYSKGQEKLTHNPVAAKISVTIDDTDGEFHAENPAGLYKTYLKTGRKIRFSTGFEVSGTPKLWQRFEGVISDITRDNLKKEIRITGFDYTQYLTEVRLKRSTNYWGTNVIKSTVQDQAKYSMPAAGNGIYVAYLDGVPIYEGEHWVYNRADNEFIFLPDHVPGSDGVDDLLIYYFTDQVPENVIADILVIAGLYADRAAVLADMDYTETGITLPRVWFASGDKCLNAIKKICERCNYQFYFKYNNKPVFNPPSTEGEWKDRVFTFTKDLITDPDYKENIDEVRTHIEIEGEKYSPSDLYFKTISGEDILPDSITTEMIQDLAITTTKIEDDSISTPKIIAGAVTTVKLDALAVTADKIAANTITADEIAVNAIDTTRLKISDSGNTEEKLVLYQGTVVVELIDYKGANVDHGITNWSQWGTLETDTFLSQRIADVNKGGIWWCALADGAIWGVWGVYAFQTEAAETAKDGGNRNLPIFEEPLYGNPATHTFGNWNPDANIWGIRTVPNGSSERNVFYVDEDGDFFYDGAGAGFQNEDDIQLVKEVEDILTSKISRTKMKGKDAFKKHKIVNVSEITEGNGKLGTEKRKKLKGHRRTRYNADGKGKRLDRYISGKKINLLFMGAIRQLNEKIESLEARLDNN